MSVKPDLLIVDDDVSVLQQIELSLLGVGELRVARSGADALRLAHERQPDLVLLDLQLGDTNGLDWLRQLRSTRHLAQTPVMFLSSEAGPFAQIRALDMDALDWLAKPIDCERLRMRVLAALDKGRRAEDQPPAVGDAITTNAVVLAVDDDPNALHAVASALGPGSFDLHVASSGPDAMVLALRALPEVLLIDVAMPGQDGFQLAAQLMAMPELTHAPIIFVTQYGQLELELRALKMGAFDFVSKPFVPEILRARVGNAVRMRRRSLQALEQAEAHWRRITGEQLTAIVAQARDPIIVLNVAGDVVLANAAARDMVGDPATLVAGAPLPAWLHDLLPPALRTGSQTTSTDITIGPLGAAAEPATYLLSTQVVNGRTERLVTLTFHDQTLQRNAEAMRLEQIRLEAQANARQLMISYLMHEIGNPLNGVVGMTNLLLMPTAEPLTDQQRGRLSMIAESAEVLRRLMSDALDLAGHAAGKFSVDLRGLALHRHIDAAMALAASSSAKRHDVQMAEPVCSPGVRVVADPIRLQQCLDNLLSNACKYSLPQGGQVRVVVLAGPVFTEISVIDNGPGLEPEEAARLFQPFERLAPQRAPGHGLGLAVTRMLAQAMRGDLTVTSSVGVGSNFTLTLPTAAPLDDRETSNA